jgi:hypothetical protein
MTFLLVTIEDGQLEHRWFVFYPSSSRFVQVSFARPAVSQKINQNLQETHSFAVLFFFLLRQAVRASPIAGTCPLVVLVRTSRILENICK